MSGFWEKWGEGRGCDTRELVMEAILCSGFSGPWGKPGKRPGGRLGLTRPKL